jgi:hypothetical protein
VTAATAPTDYDVIALVIGGIGLVLAVVSLTWNLVEYRLSGPRVKVNLLVGAGNAGGIVSTRDTSTDRSVFVSQGFTNPLVGVEVANVGRAATDVQSFTPKLSNGFGYYEPEFPGNPPLPHRLEAHATQTRWVPLHGVRAAAFASGDERASVYMEVQITGPRTLRTRSFTP